MTQKLTATENDVDLAILRLVLGIVFFAHGAQKMLGWFGGYGFAGTMGFFTNMMHIPAVFAFFGHRCGVFWRTGSNFGFSHTRRGFRYFGKYVGSCSHGPLACGFFYELDRSTEGRRL